MKTRPPKFNLAKAMDAGWKKFQKRHGIDSKRSRKLWKWSGAGQEISEYREFPDK